MSGYTEYKDPKVLEEFNRITLDGHVSLSPGRERMRTMFHTIWSDGPISAGDIDITAKIAHSSRYVSRLEAAGWIKPVPAPPGERTKTLWMATGTIGTDVIDRLPHGSVPKPNKEVKNETDQNSWNHIVDLIKQYNAPKLGGLDEETIASILKFISMEIDGLEASIGSRIAIALKSNVPSRKKFLSACNDLGIDPPRAARPMDMKELIRKKRQMARMYHPDMNSGGSDNFRRAMESFAIIEAFNEASSKI